MDHRREAQIIDKHPQPKPRSERMQPNDHSPDRLTRPRSRGRAGFVGSNAEQLPRHNNRSSSRASFLGRPRQRVYQIYEGENAADNGGTHRWRSKSRTVRGSLEEDDGFIFTDDEEAEGDRRATWGQSKRGSTNKKLASTAEEDSTSRSEGTATTLTGDSGVAAAAPIDPEKLPHQTKIPTSNSQGVQNKEKDVESQQKPKSVPRLSRIPYPIAHFLGYRKESTENRALLRPVEKLPRKIETLVWAWIGAMLGLGFVMITFSRWDQFAMSSNDPVTPWTTPIIIGSFGASSAILYGAPASPLGQPKVFVGGQFICALTSVCITKLFQLNRHYNPDLIEDSHSLVWVAGGVATGTALCLMILTDTVHPPGGATALLAATSPPVVRLGWRYLPVVLLSSVIMEVWALLWMNLGRAKYPHYWLWPAGHVNDQRNFRVKFAGFAKNKNGRGTTKV